MLFNSSISLLILFLVIQSIIKSGILKSPTIVVKLPIFHFNFGKSCFLYLGLCCVYVYDCYIFLMGWPFYHYKMLLFLSSKFCCFSVSFVWYQWSYSSFLVVVVCMMYLLHPFMLYIWMYRVPLIANICTLITFLSSLTSAFD